MQRFPSTKEWVGSFFCAFFSKQALIIVGGMAVYKDSFIYSMNVKK
jgi:hypothetical protein